MEKIIHKCMVSAALLVTCIKGISQQSSPQNLSRRNTTVTKSIGFARQATIRQYYNLGLRYKDGKNVPIDYVKAYNYFSQAASLGDAQSIFAVGYLEFKGLGTQQNYTHAAQLFAQGAYTGRDNSSYFLGLSYRNGYGLPKNEDSAKYWLTKAANNGYKQAIQELKMPSGENSNDSAKALVQQITSAALPEQYKPNTFTRITPHLPAANIIAGDYTGYLIQYDWSGQNAVSSKKLHLVIIEDGRGDLTGKWVEDAKDSTGLTAALNRDTLRFNNTSYRRRDHYSPDSAILYNFQNAQLNLVQKGDSVFLAGSVTMFSPERKEPSKPLFVALTRTGTISSNTNNPLIPNTKKDTTSGNLAAKLLKVYPNPFSTTLNVQVEIPKAGQATLELVTLTGTTVYHLNAGTIPSGVYAIPLQAGYLAPTTYLLVVKYNGHTESVKVVKK